VWSDEKNHGSLSETKKDAQEILRKFLEEKDPKKDK
jgi:hypothetical protein